MTETLTGFLGGGVDGRGLGPSAGRVEGAHRQVILGASPQAADVHRRVVGGYSHLAHRVWFGVVLPVHNLMARECTYQAFYLVFLLFCCTKTLAGIEL